MREQGGGATAAPPSLVGRRSSSRRGRSGTLDLEQGEQLAQSERLGISAAYLLHIFPEEAKAATGEDDPDFHTICQALAIGTAGKGYDKVCPRDGRFGCSFVDAVGEPHSGEATHFVSWCWSYTLGDVVSAIAGWLEASGADPAHTFLWMCFFCNNQYRIVQDETQAGSDKLRGMCERHLARCGRMLMILDSFEAPTYITRAWCIFEAYAAINAGIPITVLLPESAEASFNTLWDSGLGAAAAYLEYLDARQAIATYQADEDAIKRIMLSGPGFDAVSDAVKKHLLQWLTATFEGQAASPC